MGIKRFPTELEVSCISSGFQMYLCFPSTYPKAVQQAGTRDVKPIMNQHTPAWICRISRNDFFLFFHSSFALSVQRAVGQKGSWSLGVLLVRVKFGSSGSLQMFVSFIYWFQPSHYWTRFLVAGKFELLSSHSFMVRSAWIKTILNFLILQSRKIKYCKTRVLFSIAVLVVIKNAFKDSEGPTGS